MYSLDCFKAYDIRGVVPEQLNPELAYEIGRAFADTIGGSLVVIGHDIRLSGPTICAALSEGLMDAGVNVINIGLCGTEEIYFSVPHLNADGGICVTASHNPQNYNGMKLVGKNSVPISGDTGLNEIRERIANNSYSAKKATRGTYHKCSTRKAYIEKLLSFIDLEVLKPLKIVVNPGNGGVGEIVTLLEEFLPFSLIKVNYSPDGNFPNGVPNPLLEENRRTTSEAVRAHKADLGIAWDGDFDRCFFFDEKGEFVEGYYLVGLLAKQLLLEQKGEKIIYDPRLYWNTEKILYECGGVGVKSKTGHAFIKEKMRAENALYGGEMSAHHYFRDFYYCDNGNIPWLLIVQMLSQCQTPFSELVKDSQNAFPCSGEINLKVENPNNVLQALHREYEPFAQHIDQIDGLDMVFSEWRFNIRCSNTEPLLRINVESRNCTDLVKKKTLEVLNVVKSMCLEQ